MSDDTNSSSDKFRDEHNDNKSNNWRNIKNFFGMLFVHYHIVMAIIFALSILYISDALWSISIKNSFSDPAFRVGMLFALWGFAIALISSIRSDWQIKKLQEQIDNLSSKHIPYTSSEPVKKQLTLPSINLKNTANIATIVAAIVAITTLPFIAHGIYLNEQQLESNKISTQNLSEVVESTKNQTKALETTIKEIQHQTIVTAYSNGGVYDLIMYGNSCGKGEVQLEPNSEFIPYLSMTPIIINDKGAYSITPFRLFIDYTFLGTSAEINYNYRIIENNVHIDNPLIYDPSQSTPLEKYSFIYYPASPSPLPLLLLNKIIEKAEENNYTEIKIEIDYSFRPYSPFKQIPDWIADENEGQTKILAKLRYNENAKSWDVLDLRNTEPEIICK